jgi:serine/threonine protein kinase
MQIKSDGRTIQVIKRCPKIPEKLSAPAQDLLRRLLEKDPQHRLGCGGRGAEEVMEHEFFRGQVGKEHRSLMILSLARTIHLIITPLGIPINPPPQPPGLWRPRR